MFLFLPFVNSPMRPTPERRLEDKIRDLCANLVVSSDDDFQQALSELRAAINEHTLRIQNRTSAVVLRWPEFPQDRRKKPGR